MTESFSISQLAQEFGVTPRALRFYEDRQLLFPRREGSARIYSADDRGRLAFIVRGKRVGMSLAELKGVLDRRGLAVDGRGEARKARLALAARIETLEAQRYDLDATLQHLNAYAEALDHVLSQSASDDQVERARAFEQEANKHMESSS